MAPAELKSRGNIDVVGAKEHTSVDWPIWSNLFASFGSCTSKVNVDPYRGLAWHPVVKDRDNSTAYAAAWHLILGDARTFGFNVVYDCNVIISHLYLWILYLYFLKFISFVMFILYVHVITVVVTGSCTLPLKCFVMIVISVYVIV